MKIIPIIGLILATTLLQAETHDMSLYNEGNPFTQGQCTWYVFGRAKQATGVKIKFKQNYGRHAKNWVKLTDMELLDKPVKDSIAVWGSPKFGHVIYVENVIDGLIVYSEANTRYGKDGKDKISSIQRFENQRVKTMLFLGYLKIKSKIN